MKVIILTLLFLPSLYAAEFTNTWTEYYEKKVVMNCPHEDDFSCENFCGQKQHCEIKENICRDCIGSSIAMTYIFKYMGLNLKNNGQKVSIYEFLDLLSSGDFVSLNAKSIYNHVDRFNSLSLRRKFQSLCNNGAREPLVLFEKDARGQRISNVRYVACDEDIFQMEDNPEIILEREESPSSELY